MADDDCLTQKLLFAESDFQVALKGGSQMLSLYNQTWSSLPDFLHAASKTGSVGHETLSLAHSVASRIAHLATCFLDIRCSEESSTASFKRDWDTILHQMATLDLNADSNSKFLQSGNTYGTQPSCSSTPIPTAETPSLPFIAAAHRWFLDNLHNPYPPTEVKTRIAVTSSCQVSSVNSWFANARRRIGWTTLCRERFSNCRADMIDAAYRALVEEDPQRVLSSEIIYSFVAMKVAAEGLYSSTFSRSVFTGDLDAIIKDMGEKDRGSVKVGKRRRVGLANCTEVVAQDAYPSPDRSITGTPAPSPDHSLADGSEEEEAVSPILAGTKRHCSSVEPVDQSSSVGRPAKRLRDSMTCQVYLPSPPSSTGDVEPSSDGGSPELSPAYAIQSKKNGVTSSRKRRLSDAEDTGNMPKRPCGSIAALHTVSDPLPRFDTEDEQSFDDWFNTNSDALFNIPPPVDATEPDSSSSWQVELFKDYNIPPADTQLSAPYDLSDFDNLLQSIGSDTFAAPSGSVPPSDVGGAPYTASLDSSVPDFSQTNIDWSSFLNDPDMYQPTVYPAFPQYPADPQTPLPEIDLPMLQLPPTAPAVDSQGELASKQAKLDQLHAMQEAVRRMEQELQSEGIL